MSTVPVFNLNVPGGGSQKPPPVIQSNTPIYSSYTGNFITYGPLQKGVMTDAPMGNPNYGKPFHVVEYNPCNDTYMAHMHKRFGK